ncbi:MAG TPA: hypothetical protein VIH43_00250 [Chthoniobacterales bacterium]
MMAFFTSLALGQSTVHFWLAPRTSPGTNPNVQSFVIAVNTATAAEINQRWAQLQDVGISGHIAAGSANYNIDYYSPNHHVWNWHYTDIDQLFDLNTTSFPQCVCADLYDSPSDIDADPAAWIQANGNRYTPAAYRVVARIDPASPDNVANVSNRGRTGGGENALISGFIIHGGQPRTVIVRALGPTLSGYGVQQVVANPKLAVYSGSHRIAQNDDWATDPRAASLTADYPAFEPSDSREAALLLTLLPGAYTLQGESATGVDGVLLLEVYDVDGGGF